jgi:hypothetical protein
VAVAVAGTVTVAGTDALTGVGRGDQHHETAWGDGWKADLAP